MKFYSQMITDYPKLFPYDPLPRFLKSRPKQHRNNLP